VKYVQIIDIIAVAFLRRSFAPVDPISRLAFGEDDCVVYLPGWNPDVVDTPALQLRYMLFEPNPMLLICRDIPLESLHHGLILWGWFLVVHRDPWDMEIVKSCWVQRYVARDLGRI
jgi:hypothetical protein